MNSGRESRRVPDVDLWAIAAHDYHMQHQSLADTAASCNSSSFDALDATFAQPGSSNQSMEDLLDKRFVHLALTIH